MIKNYKNHIIEYNYTSGVGDMTSNQPNTCQMQPFTNNGYVRQACWTALRYILNIIMVVSGTP